MNLQYLSNELRRHILQLENNKRKYRLGVTLIPPRDNLPKILRTKVVEPIIRDLCNTTKQNISYRQGTSIGYYYLLINNRRFAIMYIPNPATGKIFIKCLSVHGKQCSTATLLNNISQIINYLNKFNNETNTKMEVKIEFAIIKAGNQHYLCFKDNTTYINVSNPTITFETNEDTFEIIPPDQSYENKVYQYQGHNVRLFPQLYTNGRLCICLQDITDADFIFFLTVNLVNENALGLPPHAFIDVCNNPDAMEFVLSNGLGEETAYKRNSAFSQYPLVIFNLPLIYQHSPLIFQHINI